MSAEDLKGLQKAFSEYLLTGDSAVELMIDENEQCSRKERLGVYGEAYWLRLMEALELNYPGVHTLLGDDAFFRAGREYIDIWPSHFRSIRWFGDHLAEFLRTTKPYQNEPMLAEMALFEWTRSTVFDARDQDALTEEDLAGVPANQWPVIGFVPHPSLRRMNLQWNVADFRRLIDEEKDPDPPAKANVSQGWVMWRQGLDTYWRSMGVDETAAMDAMIEGQSFENICAALLKCSDEENVAIRAAGMLKRWINEGMIVTLLGL
jgi:hypothetical protein